MHRLLFVVAVALVAVTASTRVAAQESTPGPLPPFEIAPGVTAEAIAFAVGEEAPLVYRLTFAPGVSYAVSPSPALSLGYMESGELTLTLGTAVTVTREGTMGAPGEPVAAGDEFTLTSGDYVVLPPFAEGDARNDGDEDAVLVVADVRIEGMAPSTSATPTS